MRSSGVAAGATRPPQVSTSMSLNPCSANVGVSGSTRERRTLVMPSARSRPSRTCGMTTLNGLNITSTRCDPRSTSACGPCA